MDHEELRRVLCETLDWREPEMSGLLDDLVRVIDLHVADVIARLRPEKEEN